MLLGQWVSLLVLIISIYILWQIRQVLLLVFAAVVLATVLNRVVQSLQQMRMRRGMAIAITVISLLLILLGFFAIIAPQLVEQFQQLTSLLPQAINQLRVGYDWLQTRIPGQVLENGRALGTLLQNLQTWVTRLLGNFFALVSNSVTVVLSFLLFFAATVMLLANPGQYRQVLIQAFPAFYRQRVDGILVQCEASLVGWIRGTLLAMAVIAITSYIGLLVLQVPLPLVNALLAGLLEFIPNVGPTLSVIPPALLAVLDAPWKAIAVIILYILIQQFESLILVPVVMQQQVSLLPLFTVLSVVVFSIFFGFLGLFLAVPLLIVLQIWIKEVLVKDILNQWHSNADHHE
ncbi:MAG: AI-2E family transporter [Leptolyngbyaceae bacterium]|nr:AI-2E family transporter [Leptolyngbyaceae bacterium]